jgi:hypothetical protein
MTHTLQRTAFTLGALLFGGSVLPSAVAADATIGETRLHGEVGFTYASGINKVADQMETNFGVSKDYVWPVGLRLSGYAVYANGWGFGAGIGPWEIIEVKESAYDYGDDYDHHHRSYNYIVPLTVDARYFMGGQAPGNPYVRVGVTLPVAGGDYIGSGKAGPVIAIGGEFWRGRGISLGMEAGYDGSKVQVKGDAAGLHPAKDVNPVGFIASLFVRF